ncbi:hypothetical protein AVEN_32306-1 [Araneus ventricosus]|uniref:Uncharacterized protein n=1 Tax=Araneus ventricosus TaxID=182803 RepID=A0A4Y2MCT9_ARAVE|nr:hypothetical protein AVEN_32306-1 [Araneus ventricosus]
MVRSIGKTWTMIGRSCASLTLFEKRSAFDQAVRSRSGRTCTSHQECSISTILTTPCSENSWWAVAQFSLPPQPPSFLSRGIVLLKTVCSQGLGSSSGSARNEANWGCRFSVGVLRMFFVSWEFPSEASGFVSRKLSGGWWIPAF